MRRLFGLLILPVLALPASAETPPIGEAPAAHPARQTWQQHFAQANAAHDGHLTPEQAKGGFALVAKHFNEIDVDHKGYVTEDDIRAWRITRRAAHRPAKPHDDQPQPKAASQQVRPEV